MERICSNCGGTDWLIDLNNIVNDLIPYTCKNCGLKMGIDNRTVYFEAIPDDLLDSLIEEQAGPIFELPEDEWGDPELLCGFLLMLRKDQWNHIKAEGTNTTAVETYHNGLNNKYRVVLTRQYATPTSKKQILLIDVYYPEHTLIYHNFFTDSSPQWERIAKRFREIEFVLDQHWKEYNAEFQGILEHWGAVKRALQNADKH